MHRILIVDDEQDVLDHLAGELGRSNWETGRAENGVEAVLKVMDGGWDIVLMDIRMPHLNGVNALRIIKRINPALPVIMFTGQAGQGDMLDSKRLGAYACLLKPIDFERLMSTLEACLAGTVSVQA
jgi:DNA-binding NtrC family response regulator